MKKVLAGIAILAIAAAAQAEIVKLAEWTISGSELSTTDTPNDAVVFKDMTVENNASTGLNGTSWRINNWAHNGDAPRASASLPFELNPNSVLTIDHVVVPMSVNGNPSPADFEFRKDSAAGVAITDVASASKTGSTNLTFTANDKATWTSGDSTLNGALTLVSLGHASNGSATAASTSRTDIRSGVEVYGSVAPAGSSVPEPATMSLLGLGALAIALRRKLRK